VVTERWPYDGHVPYIGAFDGVPGVIEHCLMPLSSNGEDVDIIFVVSAIGPLPPGSGRDVPPRVEIWP